MRDEYDFSGMKARKNPYAAKLKKQKKTIIRENGMIDHGTIAEDNFYRGYNCAQSVVIAFYDVTGLDEKTAAMLASSFGAGLGRMREVCGAVSGAAIVLGLVKGYSDPEDKEAKKEHYARVREFAEKFKEKNGSIICRELLAGVNNEIGGDPEERTDSYYKKRPCAQLCRQAAEILEKML